MRVQELQKDVARLRAVNANAQTCAGSRTPYGGPHLSLVPRAGPPGMRVTIVGDCFRSRHWNHGYGLFLIRVFRSPRSCEIIAGGPFSLKVDKSGASGFFTVPSSGSCFQEEYGRRVTPGLYRLGVGCHACTTARFRVTAAGGVRATGNAPG